MLVHGAEVRQMTNVCDDDADPANDLYTRLCWFMGGSALEDQCGTCDADPANDCTCVQDCAGSWGGVL